MHLEVLKPQIHLVRNMVAYYYVLQSEAKNQQRYTTFPTVNPHLMFFKGCSPVYNETDQQISFAANPGYHYEVVLGLNKPVEVNLQGKITEVCVTFHPLAISLFIDHKIGLHESANDHLKPRFQQEFAQLQQQIFSVANTDQLNRLLDYYFLPYAQQMTHQKVKNAIKLVQQRVYQVKTLAQTLQLSERQLHRLFQTYLGCSPKAFIQIARFRQSAFNKLANQALSLTELTYEYRYFDQSHFIRDYQRLTGSSPKQFYQNISALPANILWQIES
ncbi:MAG TPA: hypothetical protein DCS93_16970 [Microscillaceae bacterium]|nr:hypothetical protein [Microscillaceae bacterium]